MLGRGLGSGRAGKRGGGKYESGSSRSSSPPDSVATQEAVRRTTHEPAWPLFPFAPLLES
ncbi:Uncharacterized protein DAT39_001779 [Clarias magur]|uniref:Uncharacterized protein n=1 Tax=Clarias magur TaxID=1594786 RepID=A0A8J4UF54_CLAMG|nr:Uncharacterized protein DAT39_001779 [Clarias magur]